MNRAATQIQPVAARPAASRGEFSTIPLQLQGVTWSGNDEIVRELLAESIPLPEDVSAGGRTTVVKSGPHRTVYRVGLPSGTFFLKHFKIPDWRALVRNLISRSPAEREAAACVQVAAAGIQTTVSAVLGTTRKGLFVRDSFLLTPEIVNARPLDQVLRERLSASAQTSSPSDSAIFRRDLSDELGRLTGRLHRHGLTHSDLHPANILIATLPNTPIQLWLIDLQRVRRRRLLPLWMARGDLFGLYNSFNGIAGRSERRRFLAAYWAEATAADSLLVGLGLGGGSESVRKTARRLEVSCAHALRREQIQNDRKWQRPHRRLIVADRGWQKARGLSALGQANVLKFRDNPAALFQAGTIRFWRRRLREGRAAVVDLLVGGKTVACDVCETNRPFGWRDFFFIPGWSETRRAWEMGHALIRRRISTVRPLLYVQSRTLSCVREFLVSEPADGMVTLAVFLAHRLPGMDLASRNEWIDRVSRRLAAELGQMHQFSLVHGKLSTSNILVGVEEKYPRVQIAAVQHIERKRRLKPRDIVIELSQLETSLARASAVRPIHRLRFLRALFGTRRGAEVRRTWRAVKAELEATRRATVHSLPAAPMGRIARIRSGAAVFFAGLAIAVSMCVGCQTVDHAVALPVRYSVPGDQLLVLSDFKLQKDHELIRELNGLREQVTTILDLPVKRDPIVVYLFKDETEYRRYMNATYPRLPPRSAYFVGTSTELAVYTHWGQNVREDLRHEYTHGLLHSGLKRVPLWLDEGLAEYFEVAGPKPGGMNHDYAEHLAQAVASGWRPDLKRLENLDDSAQMKRADYQEAWAWVHYFLNTTPQAKTALVTYLAELRTNPHPKTISHRLRSGIPEYDTQFVTYISHLRPTAQAVGSL
jgi:tRNA A-37 threonylcarbamoyl transferase component Bud32